MLSVLITVKTNDPQLLQRGGCVPHHQETELAISGAPLGLRLRSV